MKALLRHGAELDVRDRDQRTPLFLAAKFGHLESVEFLVKRSADTDDVDKVSSFCSWSSLALILY
jgi:ankyrin repeat protein